MQLTPPYNTHAHVHNLTKRPKQSHEMSFYVFDLSDVLLDYIIFWIFAAVLVLSSTAKLTEAT